MKPFRTYLGVFLVSCATLTYEIGLVRLFSLAQGYHFAFMVISIALMGIGAGGAVIFVFGREKERRGPGTLALFAALLSISAVVSYAAANLILFDPVKASWSRAEFVKILAQYLILSIPFVFSGMIVSAAIRSMSERVHRVYFFDLAGAAAGCLLILAVLSWGGGEGAVVASALIALAASLVFFLPLRAGPALAPALALVILAAAWLGPGRPLEVNISPYRDLSVVENFPGGRIRQTIYSPSGRLDIVEGPAVRAAPGIGLKYQQGLPEQLGFTINGGGLSTVTSPVGDLSFLKHLPSALAYRLKDAPEVFVVEAGGGMEALSAIENGASGVWGSETSAVVIEAMKGPLFGFSGGLYQRAPVAHGHGREVLGRSGKKFDVIQLPRTDTLGSASSGIRGLSEDYALTTEAFVDYLEGLKPGGLVSVSVYLLPPPRGELKLLSTAVSALEGLGASDPGSWLMAIRSWGVLTLVVKNGRVEDHEIDRMKAFASAEGFDLVWYPGMETSEANVFNRFEAPVYYDRFRDIIDGRTRKGFFSKYLFDVRPATDDRPFFGHTFKMTRMGETFEGVGRKWGILIEGGYLLPWILAQALVASLVLIMAPLAFKGRGQGETRTLLITCAYFAAIGLGFMFVEISLIQKLIPVLGEPVYAVSAALFSILVSSGTGSYLTGRLRIMERYRAKAVLAVPALVVAYHLGLGPATEALCGLDLPLRYASTFVLLFPLGAVMGMPFPSGMSLLGKDHAGLIPWAWCVNGSFSVLSSVAVMMVAMACGFGAALVLAAGAYVGAWLSLRALGSW